MREIESVCFDEAIEDQKAVKNLINLVSAGFALQKITDAIAEMLGNRVVIADTAFKLPAYCENNVDNDSFFREYIVDNRLTDSYIRGWHSYQSNPTSYLLSHLNGPLIEMCPNSRNFTLSKKICIGTSHVATVMMSASKCPPNGLHFRLMPIIADCLGIVLQNTHAYSQSYSCLEEKLLSELIGADSTSPIDAKGGEIDGYSSELPDAPGCV